MLTKFVLMVLTKFVASVTFNNYQTGCRHLRVFRPVGITKWTLKSKREVLCLKNKDSI